MIAAVRESDGRGPPTVLSSRVLRALGIEDIDQIMHRVDSDGVSRREMGVLAKLVTEAAAEGDLVAKDIIAKGTDDLAILVATVASKLNLANSLGTVPVAVTGGLTKAGAVFLDPLRNAVERRAPACKIVKPKLPPVLGAVLIALQSLGIAPTSEIVENLSDTQTVSQ